MDCQIRRADDVAEVVLVGSLDSSWSSYLSDRIDEVIRGGALEVRVDMAGVSYLSSNGIALLVRYHRQLRQDRRPVPDRGRLRGGQPRAPADRRRPRSSATTGRRRTPAAGRRPDARWSSGRAWPCRSSRRASGGGAGAPRADRRPRAAPRRGYDAPDERTWMAVPGAAAFGLGALGPSFEACRGRFGEFLAVAGVAAYRPSAGPGRPDFEHAAGAFVPEVRLPLRAGVPGGAGGRGPLRGEGGARQRLRPAEPDRRGLPRPGRGRRGGRRARRRERRAGRRGAAAVAGRSPRRARPVRPPRGARLALAHAGARARPEHGPGRRGGDPGGGPGAGAVRPAARGGIGAGTPGPLPRGGRPLPAAPRRRGRAGARRSRTCSSPAGSRRSSTCSATRGRSSGPARARSPGGPSGTSRWRSDEGAGSP